MTKKNAQEYEEYLASLSREERNDLEINLKLVREEVSFRP
jgi:hypothetical protein